MAKSFKNVVTLMATIETFSITKYFFHLNGALKTGTEMHILQIANCMVSHEKFLLKLGTFATLN